MLGRDVLREAARLEGSNFSLLAGIRGGAFTVAPMALLLATNDLSLVYATLGAMLLTTTEGPNSTPLPLRFLLLACLTEASAFALGTVVALSGLVAIPLVGLGVCAGLLAGDSLAVAQVGRVTAIFFAVGVGLPGASAGAAPARFAFALLGGFLALAGCWLQRSVGRGAGGASSSYWSTGATRRGLRQLWPTDLSFRFHVFRWAVAAGAGSAFGLAVGLLLGLPRDFWIVVTIIVALRPRIGPTVATTLTIVAGTAVGAMLAASITLGTGDLLILGSLLLVFGVLMFASRGVNLGLVQLFFTPFIIILLNIIYPGDWRLAEIRILDVGIGGAIAILSVCSLEVFERRAHARRP